VKLADLRKDLANRLHKDPEERRRQPLAEAPEGELVREVAAGEVDTAIESNASASPGLGPCLLSDAFSCEVCLSSYCAPIATKPKAKGKKNKKGDESPFITIKNALTAPAPDFKISCTACASIQPGEKISFELEMYAVSNFHDLHTLFTSTKINLDAKTCIGPGSPLRVLFDTLGLPACESRLKAEYLPFLGDLTVEGTIPGPSGTRLRLTFDAAVHDIPEAVHAYCRGKVTLVPVIRLDFSQGVPRFRTYLKRVWGGIAYHSCIKDYRALAGPLTFGASVLIPLVVGEFKLVEVSGPHATGSKWKVELFEMPFDQVAKAIKELWDNHAGPAMEKSLNAAGEGVESAGKWTVGAANSAGKWTVGAASTVAKEVVKSPVAAPIVALFSGPRRRRWRLF